jgi:hypothetical protein
MSGGSHRNSSYGISPTRLRLFSLTVVDILQEDIDVDVSLDFMSKLYFQPEASTFMNTFIC